MSAVPPKGVLETPVVLREIARDIVLAQSVVQPALAAAGSEAEARLELELLLTEHFARVRPAQLLRFDVALPRLQHVSVVVPASELRGPLAIKTAIDIGCLVSEAPCDADADRGGDRWVHLLPFDSALYLRRGEDLEQAVRAEVQRLARARELSGAEYLALLPAARTWLESLQVPLPAHAGGQALQRARSATSSAQRREAEALLDSIGQALHARSRARPLLAREKELALLDALLGGPTRASVLLVGEVGAGKSALFASWLQARRQRGDAPAVYATSGAQLLSGMSGAGEWQARLTRVLLACERLDAVLYVEDLHDLLLAPRQRADIAGFIRPFLEAGRVRLVGELRRASLDEAERQKAGFLANLTRVVVAPLASDSALAVLQAHAAHHRKHEPQRAQLGPDALAALVELCARYLPYGVQPGAIVGLYDELRGVDRGLAAEQGAPADANQTYAWFSARSGVPLFLLRDDVSLRRESLTRALDRLLVGQDEAKRAVIDTVCVVKARLAPRDKPLASFLFMGPTGVGKTELARALAQVLFGQAERMLRFDMSEYADAYAAERLIAGSQRSDGLLTRGVRQQPFCVLLLDEIEKAHPAVYDLLLQVLGEGRLSDARGRTAFFHNSIIIMTSNLGSARRSIAGFGEPRGSDASKYADAARDAFRPEFLGRIDRIVPFAPLQRAELPAVVAMLVQRVITRSGLRRAGLAVELSAAALGELAARGFSEAYGARGVRRHLESALALPLSRLLAQPQRLRGMDCIEVSLAAEAGQPPLDVTSMLQAGGLRFSARRKHVDRPAPRHDRDDDELKVTKVRRELAHQLQLGRVESLVDRRDALVVELAQAAWRGGVPAVIAQLQAQHHELCALLDPLQAAHAQVCELEELALLALGQGEAPPSFDAAIDAAQARFARSLLSALMFEEAERHAVTLLLSELDDQRALDVWLAGYLRNAARLRHQVWVRLDAGGDKSKQTRFGAGALAPDVALQHVLAPDRSFRHVLLGVRGPEALALLGLEAGRVCYLRGDQPSASLAVALIARFADLTDAELEDSALQPRAPEALELVRRSPAVRSFDAADSQLQVCGSARLQLVERQHFDHIEQIALEHLLLFERNEALDRDAALQPALRRGPSP